MQCYVILSHQALDFSEVVSDVFTDPEEAAHEAALINRRTLRDSVKVPEIRFALGLAEKQVHSMPAEEIEATIEHLDDAAVLTLLDRGGARMATVHEAKLRTAS